MMLRSTESEHPRLIGHKIIFVVFQPMWPRYLNVTGGRTDDYWRTKEGKNK